MSGTASVVRGLVSVVSEACRRPTEQDCTSGDDFESLVASTRETFRPRSRSAHRSANTRVCRRGRPTTSSWKVAIFLMRRCNADYMPQKIELKHLQESGFGCPRTAIEGKIVVGRLWPVDVLEQHIYGLYPNQPLQLVGFKYAHFDKQKRIKVQDNIVSVKQLATDIGKGRLLIIPNRDLPQPLVDRGSPHHMPSPVMDSSNDLPDIPWLETMNNPTSSSLVHNANVDTPVVQFRINRPGFNESMNDDNHVSLSDDEFVVLGSEPSTVTQSTIPSVRGFSGLVDNHGQSNAQIRNYQDEEYQASLRADQEKERQVAEEATAISRIAQRRQNIRLMHASLLPPEPLRGFVVRVSVAGRTFERKFSKEQSIETLMNYIGSLDVEATGDKFVVKLPGTTVALCSDLKHGSMEENGLSQSSTVHVLYSESLEEQSSHVVPDDEPANSRFQVVVPVTAPPNDEPVSLSAYEDEQVTENVGNRSNDLYSVWIPGRSASRVTSKRALPPGFGRSLHHASDFMVQQDVVPHSVSGNGPVAQPNDTSTQSFEVALTVFASTVIMTKPEEEGLSMMVRRHFALTDSIELIELCDESNIFKEFRVTFVGESAVDGGGPRRELATLVVLQAPQSHLMTGSALSCDINAMQNLDYLHFGRLVSLLLLQGGPGCPVFDAPVAEYILTRKILTLHEAHFPEALRPCIRQLIECSPSEIDSILPDRHQLGSTKPSSTMTAEDVRLVIQAMYLREVIGSWHASLSQFIEGLNIGGVLTFLKKQGLSKCRHCFDRTAVPKLSAARLEKNTRYVFNALPGSNDRRAEDDVARSWSYFIRAVEAGRAEAQVDDLPLKLSCEDVLFWVTGSRYIPACGFANPIEIHFDKNKVLPMVHTCGPSVTLPVTGDLRSGRRSVHVFVAWILNSPGFGQV